MIYYANLIDPYGFDDGGFFCENCLENKICEGYIVESKIQCDDIAIECEDCIDWVIDSYEEFYESDNPCIKKLYLKELEIAELSN